MSETDKTRKKLKRLGRYMVREVLGKGTHGCVYRGYDPYVGRQVAIKVENFVEEKKDESSLQTHQNLFKEARTTGFLHHPNIVALHDVGVENDIYYIVMEYIEGKTLAHYCAGSSTALSSNPQKIIQIANECCLALEYSHTNYVLHRDIKPSNIMITTKGSAKIMDFSIAHKLHVEDESKLVIGSPTYMSPEQIMSLKLTETTDQFSLAVVLYYVFCKKPPLYSTEIKDLFRHILRTVPEPISTIRSDLPKELSNIIAKAMSKKSEDRFTSIREFAEELTNVYKPTIALKENREKQKDAISKLSFFQSFSQNEVDELVDTSSLLHSEAGKKIISEGDEDNFIYLVISGEVDITKNNIYVSTLKSGDCFGELVFLGRNINLKRTATAVSKRDSLCLKIDPSVMESLSIETKLSCYRVLSENLAYRVSVTTANLINKG